MGLRNLGTQSQDNTQIDALLGSPAASTPKAQRELPCAVSIRDAREPSGHLPIGQRWGTGERNLFSCLVAEARLLGAYRPIRV
jgi:hypothetical protein